MKKILVVISVLVVVGLLISTIILADQNRQKNQRILNLLSQNDDLSGTIKSLEENVATLETDKKSVEEKLKEEEHKVYLREKLIQINALSMSPSTVRSNIAQIALYNRGLETMEDLADIFYISGEATSAWTVVEDKKLNSIAKVVYGGPYKLVITTK